MAKTFTAQRTNETPPVEFTISDGNGIEVGTFRATRKPRMDVAQMLATAVQLSEGNRVYNVNVLADAIRAMLVRKVWQPPVNDGEQGQWIPADDVERFDQLLTSDEWAIPIEQLGEICMWLLTETTGHPTGAPNPS